MSDRLAFSRETVSHKGKTSRIWSFVAIFVATQGALPFFAYGEEPVATPKSEYGIGISVLRLPDYIGSEQSSTKVLPFPHIRLNNKYVEIDRGEARGKIFNSDIFDFSLSFSGSLPLNSDDNRQRIDMPDLDAIAEAGPALRIKIIKPTDSSESKLYLELPFRAAFSISSKKFDHIGWRWGLNLAYKYNWGEWRFSQRLGVEFSNSEFHNYIYGVEQPYVTDTRTFYDSDSGFTASRVSSGISRMYGSWWVGGFVSYYSLAESEIRHSPLVTSNNAFTVGLAIAKVFKKK